MSAELETADEACVFEQILDYLLKGAYPSNASKGQKLVIRRRAKVCLCVRVCVYACVRDVCDMCLYRSTSIG